MIPRAAMPMLGLGRYASAAALRAARSALRATISTTTAAADDAQDAGAQPPTLAPYAPPRSQPSQFCGGTRATITTSAAANAESRVGPSTLAPYSPPPLSPVVVVHKLGLDILRDPVVNAGTAFTREERERLHLRGLLPPRVTTLRWQMDRFLASFESGENLVPAEELQEAVGVTRDMAIKWKRLQALQDRNESLFYMLLIERFEEMAPLVYTPTVGWVCQNYFRLYRRPRGMFFSSQDKGAFAAMTLNYHRDVDAIVLTDGGRILGLGDLGANGIGISVGKLDLYCAAAGFDPSRVLPVVLDCGTDNERLLRDPLYMGVRHERLKGVEYYELMDELIGALTRRWPKAVLQFEDLNISVARPLLERYRHHHVVFNDDIQGTAAVALAGLYSAMRAQGLPRSALGAQRVVVVGAGSAGMGVVETLARGMERSASAGGSVALPRGGAAGRFWVLDKDGLITSARRDLPAHVAPFARRVEATTTSTDEDDATTTGAGDDPAALADAEGEDLLSVVKRVRPTVLLGLAGAGKLFTPQVLRAMADGVASHAGGRKGMATRPVVFAMSNPTSRLECTAQEAYDHTDGTALYASGSPQPEVVLHKRHHQNSGGGETLRTSQSNNLYVFGGLALGAHLAKARAVTDNMLMAAAEVLPELVSEEDARKGLLYPPLSEIRFVSAAVAAAVMRAAAADGLVTDGTVLGALAGSDERLRAWVARRMWKPSTGTSLAYLPPGVGE